MKKEDILAVLKEYAYPAPMINMKRGRAISEEDLDDIAERIANLSTEEPQERFLADKELVDEAKHVSKMFLVSGARPIAEGFAWALESVQCTPVEHSNKLYFAASFTGARITGNFSPDGRPVAEFKKALLNAQEFLEFVSVPVPYPTLRNPGVDC